MRRHCLLTLTMILVSLAAWLFGAIGPIPLEIMLVVQSIFAIALRLRVRRLDRPSRNLSRTC